MMDAHINLAKEYAMTSPRRPSKEAIDQEVVPTTEFSSVETTDEAQEEVAAKLAAAQLDEAQPVVETAAEVMPEAQVTEKKEDTEADKEVEATSTAEVTVTPPEAKDDLPAPKVVDPLLNPSIAASLGHTLLGRRTPSPVPAVTAENTVDQTAEQAAVTRPGSR
jgi:hypothetical protein